MSIIEDKNSTWKTVRDEIRLEEMADLRLCVAGMPPGDFDVEWWNTYTGEVFGQAEVRAADGTLILGVPRFSRDIAAVIRRHGP